MKTLPIMEKLLDLSADQAGGAKACLPDSAKACLPDSAKTCLPDSAKACLPDRQVEWTSLGDERFVEIANSARKPVKAALREAGEIPYYGANNIQDYVHSHTHEGNYVLIAEDGSASLERYSVQYASGKFWANNHVHVVRGKAGLETKFLYHYLQTVNFIPFLNGGDRAKLTKGEMVKIQIPIPPLNVQAEIVRILDAFTAYTAELTAELTARKKQYNHYRDQLLSFSETEACLPNSAKACLPNRQVEWKQLGDVADFTYGYAAKAQDAGDARFVRITDINNDGKLIIDDQKFVDVSEDNNKFLLKHNDLLMARTGATYGKTMIFEEDYQAIFAGFLIRIKFAPNLVIPKFYWHFAQSKHFWHQANKLVSGGGQPQFNANALCSVKIQIPTLEEQARIVAILDKFDALTASISEGLPREIELRQKQYEYYRDRLLSFPKPASDAAV